VMMNLLIIKFCPSIIQSTTEGYFDSHSQDSLQTL
jgi:hypothetical protein